MTQVAVSLEDNQAKVTMETEVTDEVLTAAVTEAGYKVLACRAE